MTTCTELSPSMIREAEERAARNPDSLLNRLRAAREPQIEWTDCTTNPLKMLLPRGMTMPTGSEFAVAPDSPRLTPRSSVSPRHKGE